jgi:hypothetical protein
MGGTAGYKHKLQIKDGGGAWLTLPTESVDFTNDHETLDSKEGGEADSYDRTIIGIRDYTVQASMNWKTDSGDTKDPAFVRLESFWLTNPDNQIDLRYLPDGVTANGYDLKMKLSNLSLPSEVKGKSMVSATFKADGVIAAAV